MPSNTLHIDAYLGDPSCLDRLVDGHSVSLLIDSSLCSFHQVQLPEVAKRKWPMLLPFLLEDQLLIAPEDAHIVLLQVNAENIADVCVVARADMNRLSLLIETNKERIDALVPDVLALPWQEGRISVASVGENLLCRVARYQGFCVPLSVAEHLLMQQEPKQRLALDLYNLSESTFSERLRERAEFSEAGLDWRHAELDTSANLLVGEYRKRRSSGRFKPFLPAFAAALLAMIFAVAWVTIDYRKSGEEIAKLDAAISDHFRAYFGEPLADPNRTRQQAAALISRRELQYFSVKSGVLAQLKDLDAILFACADCKLTSVRVEESQITMQMNEDARAIGQIESLANSVVTKSGSDEAGLITINLKPRATP